MPWFKVRVGYLNSRLRFIKEVIQDFRVKNNLNASMLLLGRGWGLNHPHFHHFHLRGFFKLKKKITSKFGHHLYYGKWRTLMEPCWHY
jgi:hypothetical protein